ncbi:uncharacterized protein LOC107517942 isoform X1 [Rousettus aegyptiacus]|uniref:uncharacterized protein LOC107517942 isoform X1 n=1 Tax=Rousettus aegyptiacus TaxID=9407 RepID=UPI00168D6FD6|nr:uncharacterized protein LOC107517942 isoform X1 [Rousettus aegyptiacus]
MKDPAGGVCEEEEEGGRREEDRSPRGGGATACLQPPSQRMTTPVLIPALEERVLAYNISPFGPWINFKGGLFLQMDLQVLYSMGLFRGQCLKCIKLWHPLYNNSQLMLLCESRGKLCTKQCSLAFLCLFSQFLSSLKKRPVNCSPPHTFPTKLWHVSF